MDTQVACRFCGAPNVATALSCAECFMPIVDELAGGADVAAPAPIVFGPYTGPPRPPADGPPAEPPPQPNASPAPPAGYRLGATIIPGWDARREREPAAPRPGHVPWRWYHLVLLSSIVWWGPMAAGRLLEANRSISGLLTRGFTLQIVGYLLGFAAVAGLVITRQNGDWGSLGLRRKESSRRDLGRGALFGGLVFLAYLPVALALSHGQMGLDHLATLVIGNASGIGLALAAIVAMVGAPMIEEIFYRGMLYEKVAARRGRVPAIVITTIAFTLAHGAWFIPPITLLGASLAFRRKDEGLWFTMGAHSTWNAIVTVIAVVALTGGALSFTSRSGALALEYPRDWQRHSEGEVANASVSVDLALGQANGSMIVVAEAPGLPAYMTKADVRRRIEQVPTLLAGMPGGVRVGPMTRSTADLDGDPLAYEVGFSATSSTGVAGRGRVVVVVPNGSTTLYAFAVTCPEISCTTANRDFDDMLESARFL